MAFGFLKKKKATLDLPPPPPPAAVEMPKEDIPAVSGKEVEIAPPPPKAEMPPPPKKEVVKEEVLPPKGILPLPPEKMPTTEEIPPLPTEIAPEMPLEEAAPDIPPLPTVPEHAEIPKVPKHIETPMPVVERKGEIVFDKTVSEEKLQVEVPEEAVELSKPLFVSVQDYQEILNGIQTTKHALEEAEEVINKLNDLKNAQERIFEDWKNQMEDVERKLSYVDEVIAQGE